MERRAGWVGSDAEGTTLAIDGRPPVAFTFKDTLRPGVAELLAQLAHRDLPETLLSGDTTDNVAQFAHSIGVTDWRACVLPDEKADFLAELTASGKHVLMVGDGLNDTAALATAHVSIAPASALDATRVAADIVLVAKDVSRIEDGLRIARSARAHSGKFWRGGLL